MMSSALHFILFTLSFEWKMIDNFRPANKRIVFFFQHNALVRNSLCILCLALSFTVHYTHRPGITSKIVWPAVNFGDMEWQSSLLFKLISRCDSRWYTFNESNSYITLSVFCQFFFFLVYVSRVWIKLLRFFRLVFDPSCHKLNTNKRDHFFCLSRYSFCSFFGNDRKFEYNNALNWSLP